MHESQLSFIELGHTGIPMALNLIKAGFELSVYTIYTVYNQSADKTKPLTDIGTKVYTSLDNIRENLDVIFTMLSDDAVVASVLLNMRKQIEM